MKPRSPRHSLGARLAILIFIAEAIVLGTFALLLHGSVRQSIQGSFDRALQANAEALATLVEEEEDAKEGIDFDFADEIMPGFSAAHDPDLFAVILGGRMILESSVDESGIPAQVWNTKETLTFFDHDQKQRPYRAVVLSTYRFPDGDAGRAKQIRVYFAAGRSGLDAQFARLRLTILGLCTAVLLISALVARAVAAAGLRPLNALARDIARITEDRLDARLEEEPLPSDLVPISASVNELLDRIKDALHRERQFSADAAHELRTPIATLKSGIQAALLNPGPDRSPNDIYNELLEDVERIEGLCNALLLLTGGNSAPDSTLATKEWIAEIKAATESVRDLPHASGLTITLSIKDEKPPAALSVDRQATFRIVSNLVDNAARHGGPGISIRVCVEFPEDDALLIVEDNGPGIPAEESPHLFERFHRADKSRSRAAGGYGLGLSICRALARSFGGDVTHETVQPHGARFIWKTKVSRKT